MEPVLWLLAPFAITALVAIVLHLRDRPLSADAAADRRRKELQRVADVLGPGTR